MIKRTFDGKEYEIVNERELGGLQMYYANPNEEGNILDNADLRNADRYVVAYPTGKDGDLNQIMITCRGDFEFVKNIIKVMLLQLPTDEALNEVIKSYNQAIFSDKDTDEIHKVLFSLFTGRDMATFSSQQTDEKDKEIENLKQINKTLEAQIETYKFALDKLTGEKA